MVKVETNWQRARRPEQKAERQSTILKAAATLLDAEGLEGTGINAIAREAGISKPNLYRYFESREAILLELLVTEHKAWAVDFASRLQDLKENQVVAGIADAFAESMENRKRYSILIGSLATVLEHNVSKKTVVDFKRHLMGENALLIPALKQALPSLSEEQSFSLLAMLIMSASGFWPHCHPAPVVKEVLKKPEFASMRFHFKEMVKQHAECVLKGMLG